MGHQRPYVRTGCRCCVGLQDQRFSSGLNRRADAESCESLAAVAFASLIRAVMLTETAVVIGLVSCYLAENRAAEA